MVVMSHKVTGIDRLAFIRIPKTGGTSIISIIESLGHDHKDKLTYVCTEKHLNVIDLYDTFTAPTFAFVRNPWDRAVSSWKFGSWHDDWNMGFLEFCRNLNSLEIYPSTKIATSGLLLHVCEQHTFVINEETGTRADFIGKFESLQQDFNTVCGMVGLPPQTLPHLNRTNHKHYTEYYDDESRELVAERYAKDIEYFGYKYGE